MTINIEDEDGNYSQSPHLRGSVTQALLSWILCPEMESRDLPGLGSHWEFRALFQVHSDVGSTQVPVFSLALNGSQLSIRPNLSYLPPPQVLTLPVFPLKGSLIMSDSSHVNSKPSEVIFHLVPRLVCLQGRVFHEAEAPGVGILGPFWNSAHHS